MTQTLYIFRGLPASGKSTIAQKMVDKSYGSIVRIERDMLRDQLFNNRFYTLKQSGWDISQEEFDLYLSVRENTITQVQYSMVSTALNTNKSVIISDTNLPAKVVKGWITVANKHNVAYEIVNFDDVDIDTLIKRDAARPNAVGEEVIRRMAKDHLVKGKLRPVVHTPVKVLEVEPYDNPTELPSAVIVDIDGTMAQMSGRSPYEWHRVGEDAPVDAVIDAVRSAFKAGHHIIVMSGRDGSCRQLTNQWVWDHTGIVPAFYDLFMRAEGDNRKDDLVKYELFNAHVRDKYHVKYVLDDRDQVVRMWRKLGLHCFQVAEGAF